MLMESENIRSNFGLKMILGYLFMRCLNTSVALTQLSDYIVEFKATSHKSSLEKHILEVARARRPSTRTRYLLRDPPSQVRTVSEGANYGGNFVIFVIAASRVLMSDGSVQSIRNKILRSTHFKVVYCAKTCLMFQLFALRLLSSYFNSSAG